MAFLGVGALTVLLLALLATIAERKREAEMAGVLGEATDYARQGQLAAAGDARKPSLPGRAGRGSVRGGADGRAV